MLNSLKYYCAWDRTLHDWMSNRVVSDAMLADAAAIWCCVYLQNASPHPAVQPDTHQTYPLTHPDNT